MEGFLTAEGDSSGPARHQTVPGGEIVLSAAGNQISVAVDLRFRALAVLTRQEGRIQRSRRDIVIWRRKVVPHAKI